MLKIKLARFGKRNQPHYRIVVNEARSKRDGKYVALLGHYAPTQDPKILELNLKAYKKWIEDGAQPTDTVAHLAERYESGNPFPEKKKKPSKKSKAKAAEEKAAKEAPKEEPAEEKPAAKAEEAAPEEEVADKPAKEESPADTDKSKE